MNPTVDPRPVNDLTPGLQPKCTTCGNLLHRSRAKTRAERLVRLVSRRKKYRCGGCGRTSWRTSALIETWRARAAAEALRIRKDPIARRALRLRWRRALIAAFAALLCGVLLGVVLARSQEAQPTGETSDP